jgi:hypothetical protein
MLLLLEHSRTFKMPAYKYAYSKQCDGLAVANANP